MSNTPVQDNLWYDDILGGCVENLFRVGRSIYVGENKIGYIEDYYYPERKCKVEVGDHRYGCCGDIIVRPHGDSYLLLEPKEAWFYAKVGEGFRVEEGFVIKLDEGWQEVVAQYLKPYKAEFVFSKV